MPWASRSIPLQSILLLNNPEPWGNSRGWEPWVVLGAGTGKPQHPRELRKAPMKPSIVPMAGEGGVRQKIGKHKKKSKISENVSAKSHFLPGTGCSNM